MEVHDAEVEWYERFGNDPKLVLSIDDRPSRDELQFARSGHHWVAVLDGYVEYYSWSGGDGRGYNGRHYDITTVDGEEVTLKGPGSSRAGCVNATPLGPVVDVRFKYAGDGPAPAGFGSIGAVTLEVAEDALQYLDESVALEPIMTTSVPGNSEVRWVPTRV